MIGKRMLAAGAVVLMALGVGACGGEGGSSEVSRDEALSWPSKVCQVREGMNPAEVRAIMGEPTVVGPESDYFLRWKAFQFDIMIGFNEVNDRVEGDSVVSADIEDAEVDLIDFDWSESLTDEDRALFPCPIETY